MPLLPGAVLMLGQGGPCDRHTNRPAIKRVAGECDSFGHEEILMCQVCYDKLKAHQERTRDGVNGYCVWCKNQAGTIKPFRDVEEGSSGPVYHVCQPCREKHNTYINEGYNNDSYS
jgi:hypothetical protein